MKEKTKSWQAIEKILKACVQEKTTEDPRRTHNFKHLCQQGNFSLPPHVEEFLARLSPHYLSSKYPEDLKQYYRDYTLEVAREWVSKTREVFTWFKQFTTS